LVRRYTTNQLTHFKTHCQGENKTCLPSLLIFAFEGKTWTGHGDGDANCESTGRDFNFHRLNQRGSAKRGGRPAASASFHGKTVALSFRKARRWPPAPAGTSKYPVPLCFLKSEEGQGNKIFSVPFGRPGSLDSQTPRSDSDASSREPL
jgi:hypothetical protein